MSRIKSRKQRRRLHVIRTKEKEKRQTVLGLELGIGNEVRQSNLPYSKSLSAYTATATISSCQPIALPHKYILIMIFMYDIIIIRTVWPSKRPTSITAVTPVTTYFTAGTPLFLAKYQ